MKLYSRGQLIFYSLLSALIVALFAIGLGFIKIDAGAVSTNNQIKNTAAMDQTSPALQLQQSATAVAAKTVADITPYTQDELENIDVYERLNEAVVNITTETVAINWFLEPVPQDGGSGSGSIIDTRGYVLTNNHVIENAYKIFINLADGSQFEGKVIGTDPENDIAVLKFDPPKGMQLKTVPFGDSASLKVGQKVLAIGNPFALERTLTVGIVSGLGRPIQTSSNTIIRDMIQTDASINPGNSGGPLLDSQGRMIGMNTMIYSPSGGSVGIGFAVPVNTAKRVVAELIQYGKVRRGWIDATVVQLFPALVNYAKLPVSSGLLVSQTKKGGFAERAGIRQGSEPVRYGNSVIYLGGDIITMVDGIKITRLADLYSALEDNKPGDKVAVEINRNGKTISLTVTLADREQVLAK
ncbi:MAG TPA: trypsin-like peptidase domain-containing protein [Treponema sp.]|jgi:S1-C subfamily serine protease|uniref:S1C family serine protease n=1 Tax=Gracilinema caldarium TaxID=215591 RepID=UPI00168FD7FB|nr:trypsin-like peptidase domain-containing protein [Gracilinema caldarium]NLJ09069.1 trypsin-like serine protease [Treponema sp.]HON13589.1 trypsin-like peptidase domain-containing protein [Treponema sp.]HRS04270.1 trypsin-like peptidase domain-containing protein [Treponema sp.]HRU28945.1 trypsin-like peptidase domain-containing protein [Treponema sp.]